MCGLAGFAEVACSEQAAQTLLTSLADCLAHRGPDASGTCWHAEDRVGLAHRRLAILDQGATGDQPMVSASGRTAIAFNGEIVNALELTHLLARSGVRLRGRSDTEVLLEAIEVWGIDRALELAAGMFAFALHDRALHRLHLVRDRLGVKPLHWTRLPTGVAFSSELRALRRMPGFRADVDPEAVKAFLAHGCVTGTRCIWRGIEKVAPGHRVEYQIGSGTTRTTRWWDPLAVAVHGCSDPFRGDDRDAVEVGTALATRVIQEHLLSDVPVACFLSGGIDSRMVAALARGRQHSGAPRCFTACFDDPLFDERDAAAQAARTLGLPWEPIEISERTLIDTVPQLADVFDEPFADSSQVPTLVLSREVRGRAAVALSGDGGDELFGGYRRHVHAHRRWDLGEVRGVPARVARMLPPDSLARATRLAARILPSMRGLREPDEAARKWGVLHTARSQREAYAGLVTDRRRATDWWRTDAERVLPDALRRFQFMDQTGYLPDDPLVKVDRASMSCGLEVRVPLLDHRLVAFAWSLPPRLKVRDGTGKWLLRAMLDQMGIGLGEASPKRGFAVPLVAWLRGPLRSWSEDLVQTPEALPDPVRTDEARSTLDRARSGCSDAAHRAWRILMYASWARRWRPGA